MNPHEIRSLYASSTCYTTYVSVLMTSSPNDTNYLNNVKLFPVRLSQLTAMSFTPFTNLSKDWFNERIS